MTDEPGNNSFRGRGLFAKYVFSLVGLVLFVLAVNSAIETYFVYRETQSSLINAMAEKADTTVSRIQQFVDETERQISWITAGSRKPEQRRDDYLLLLRQVPAVNQVYQADSSGRAQLRVSRSTVAVIEPNNARDFARDITANDASKSLWSGETRFEGGQPIMYVTAEHPRREDGFSIIELNLRFLTDFVTSGQAGRIGNAYIVSQKGRLLASSDPDWKIGTDLSRLPQVAAMLGSSPQPRATGTGRDGEPVLVAAKLVPDLNWSVIYEQPLSQAFVPIKDLLIRAVGLVGLGLLLAMIAGTVLTRRMLVPIRALHAGARRLAAGDFSTHIGVKTHDELEELA